jgi:hypothetical protein
VDAKHHFRVVDEIAVARDRALAVFVRKNFGQFSPGRRLRHRAGSVLLKKQHIGHDIGARPFAHAARGQADGGDQASHARDVLLRGRVRLVHGEAVVTKAARPPGFSRSSARAMK